MKFCPSCTTNYKLRLGWFFSVKNLAEYVLEFAIVVNVDISNSTELQISRSQSPRHCSLKPKSKTALDSYKYKRTYECIQEFFIMLTLDIITNKQLADIHCGVSRLTYCSVHFEQKVHKESKQCSHVCMYLKVVCACVPLSLSRIWHWHKSTLNCKLCDTMLNHCWLMSQITVNDVRFTHELLSSTLDRKWWKPLINLL